MPDVSIQAIMTSAGHRYVGRYGKEPAPYEAREQSEVECVAGRGIRGDRYFDHREDFKGQITFFEFGVLEEVCKTFHHELDLTAVRRNVFVCGLDLNPLIGQIFSLQGVRFEGVEECKPCFWMDEALAPGAEDALKGRGGLRARILTDGVLRPGNATFTLEKSA